jgi:hypothetical protein
MGKVRVSFEATFTDGDSNLVTTDKRFVRKVLNKRFKTMPEIIGFIRVLEEEDWQKQLEEDED